MPERQQLLAYDIIDLYDLLVDNRDQLLALENSPQNTPLIKEKKEYILVLQNVICLKKLDHIVLFRDVFIEPSRY